MHYFPRQPIPGAESPQVHESMAAQHQANRYDRHDDKDNRNLATRQGMAGIFSGCQAF